jgi:DNA-directed RNA polymerase
LQKTAYTLNNFVVEVAEVLMGRGYVVGKFVPIVEMPMPVKPIDIADNEEARHAYRRAAAETMNLNAQTFKRSCRTRKTMNTVELFKGRERWYLPASFDTRGRCYFLPAYLTPHDTDFGKALIKFADPSFMTDEAEGWLAFHVATAHSLSKGTMAERQEWTKSNHDLISRVASNPLEYLSDWEGADDPWQFLAACEEYNACVIECSRQWTNLPVGIDATCSGLQILSAISKDANTAKLVNVIPSDRPQDAYKAVAEAAKPKLPEHLAAMLDRKVCKRAVMVIPYNGSRHSIRSYIREALRDKKAEFTPEDLTLITNAVWDSMGEVVPGAMRVMEWMKREVGNAFKRGADHLEWITPTGFHVFQDRRVSNVKTIKLQILGRCEIQVGDGYKGPDVARHKSSTMPNAIHSLDASLLQAAFLRFNAPFTVIHDCVLCRATEMGQLNRVIRETFYELFADNNFLQYFAEMLGAETEPPIIGDLDLNSVHDSTYFFC